MRISDLSSDVCSSDLQHIAALLIFEAFQNLVRIDRPYAGHNLFIFDGFPRWFVYLPKGNLSAAFGGRIDFHCYGDQRQPDIDRKSVVYGKSVYVRVDLGGRRISKKKQKKDTYRL